MARQSKIKVGDLRSVPKGIMFWSTKNQANLMTTEETIIKVTNRVYGDNDYVFAAPQQILFEHLIPGITAKGNDSWGISLKKTSPYKMPKGAPNLYQ